MRYTQLQLLHNLAHDQLSRRRDADPDKNLHELIRETADYMVPEGQDGVLTLLTLATENIAFATAMPAHWTFTEWEEAGNACTPLALIRENVYQWVVTELETYEAQYTR